LLEIRSCPNPAPSDIGSASSTWLRVECARCNRSGRYSVAKLVAERGPDAKLTDWLSECTRDCPQKNQAGVVRACDAIMPDLIGLR
jgi:hypothetical protein